MTRCVVPLRTSVEWFDNPLSPAIEGRVKQAAVLYDEVVVEDGLLEIDITDGGSIQQWLPPEMSTTERMAKANRPVAVGAPVTLSMAIQEGPGMPAEAEKAHVMMAGQLQQRYVAELMYSVLSHVAEFNDGWATISFTGDRDASSIDAGLPFKSSQAVWDRTLMPELRQRSPWLREFAIKAFDRDAALAAAINADLHVSPLFKPIAAHRSSTREPRDGPLTTLEYLFPNVTAMPWQLVMEFREHEACLAARAKLRSIVDHAQEHGPYAAEARLSRDLVLAEKDLRRRHSFSERLGKIAASFVPLAGGALGEAASAAADHERGKADWGAAVSLLAVERT
jgi:hypothetical protein